jgi:hypothetical protein
MSWEEARARLDNSEFPKDITGFSELNAGEYHQLKKAIHGLVSYKKYLEPILGYEVEAKYSFCKACKEIRTKVLTLYNNEDGVAHTRWFKYHGTEVEKGVDTVI